MTIFFHVFDDVNNFPNLSATDLSAFINEEK